MRVRFAIVLAAAVPLALAPFPRASAQDEIIPPLAPAVVLYQYGSALEHLSRPPSVEFEVSMEQVGPRNIEQTHRIYRQGLNERDEILSVDGQALTTPAVRIFGDRTYRYDVAAVAPHLADYTFSFVDTEPKGSRLLYRFKAAPRTPGDFAVSDVFIDDTSFLPAIVRYRVTGGGVHGSGELHFGRTERYWVIREATVSVHLPSGALGRERIAWSKYAFPASLPRSTFTAPRALGAEAPEP